MPSFAKTNTLTEAQVVLRAVLIASLAITFPFVFLRCFVRAQVQSRFSIDDYLLVAALVAFAIQQSLSIYAIDYGGFGRKTSELPREVLLKGIKWIVIAQSTYTLALMLAKLSVAFLQLRVIGLSTLMLRRIHYATVVINLVIGLYEFFTLLFQCYPNGDPIVIFGNAHKCTTRRPVVISVYIYSAVNILLDWYYSFAMVPLIWRLQNMRTVVKVSVIVILGMGFFASIATIIRLKYLLGFDDSHDPLLAVVPTALWSSVEQCVGMCAACIATFRPLLRLIPSLVSSRGRSKGSSSACRNGCNDVDGGDARLSMTLKSRLSGRQRRAIGAEGADGLSLEDLEGASVIEGESWSEEEGDGHGLRTSEAVVEYRSEGVFAKATTTLPGHDGQHAFGDLQASVASVATSKDGAEVGTVADDAESQRNILRPKQSVSRPGHS